MAVAKVVELKHLLKDFGAGQPVGMMDEDTTVQSVTYDASTQSAAFGSGTRVITITAIAALYYAIGSDPTATTGAGSDYIPAGGFKSWGVKAGDKIAFYDGTTS